MASWSHLPGGWRCSSCAQQYGKMCKHAYMCTCTHTPDISLHICAHTYTPDVNMHICVHTHTPDDASFRWEGLFSGANSNVVPLEELDFILRGGIDSTLLSPSVGSRHQPLAGFRSENLALWGWPGCRGSNGHSQTGEAGIRLGQVSRTLSGKPTIRKESGLLKAADTKAQHLLWPRSRMDRRRGSEAVLGEQESAPQPGSGGLGTPYRSFIPWLSWTRHVSLGTD